jgi:hypothetical protein
MRCALWLALAAAMAGGCVAPRMSDSPMLARANPYDTENEMIVRTDQPGPEAYARLFERVLDVVDDEFEIAFASRYDGRIEASPRIAPGLEQPFKPGSPNLYERLLASCQTYRHRCFVVIQPARDGYLINVTVFKELEDLPNPTREISGGAAFRSEHNIDREFEIVDPAIVSNVWIPKGRDVPLEQKILRKIRWALRQA